MKNPFDNQIVPSDYRNLKERMYKKVSEQVNEQIRGIMVKAYENSLSEENIILARAERRRLLSQITQMVMEDILMKFDDGPAKKE